MLGERDASPTGNCRSATTHARLLSSLPDILFDHELLRRAHGTIRGVDQRESVLSALPCHWFARCIYGVADRKWSGSDHGSQVREIIGGQCAGHRVDELVV